MKRVPTLRKLRRKPVRHWGYLQPLADWLTQCSLSNPAVIGPLLWPVEADDLLTLTVVGVVEYGLVDTITDQGDGCALPAPIFRELIS